MSRILSKREYALALATGIAIAGAVFIRVLVMPAIQKNRDFDRAIASSRSRAAQYEWLIKNKKNIEENFKAVYYFSPREESNPTYSVKVLLELESVVREAGLKVVDLRLQQGKNFKSKDLMIELKTEGPLESYLKCVYFFEHSAALFTVHRLRIAAQANSENLEGGMTVSPLIQE
ncbi:MAG: hypothetical protein PHE58_02640 [Candidatus Omnitrophica bacterium]|nr:hypothetical protein [Candidatus Omnitrophota bacterium]